MAAASGEGWKLVLPDFFASGGCGGCKFVGEEWSRGLFTISSLLRTEQDEVVVRTGRCDEWMRWDGGERFGQGRTLVGRRIFRSF